MSVGTENTSANEEIVIKENNDKKDTNDIEYDDETQEKRKKDAEEEKEIGTKYYKGRNFTQALEHYNKALELNPNNAVYALNISAVYFEMHEYEKCIEWCTKSYDIYIKYRNLSIQQVAKMYLRKANAHVNLKQFDQAIESYKRSIQEENNRTTRDLLRKAEQSKRQYDEEQYLDPIKSEEAKQEGNKYFNEGNWTKAIEFYTESLKRDPKNYKVYSNRAACYTKILQWDKGLEDCNKCLEIEPTFVKAYIRKGRIQHFLKQYPQAIDTYTKGLELEPGCQDLIDGLQQTRMEIYKSNSSNTVDEQRIQESFKDPEIRAILQDPQINMIIKELSANPSSPNIQKYLSEPRIARAFEKLMAAGIFRVG